MLLAGHSFAVQYLGCFTIATGLYVIGGLVLVWMPSNVPWYDKRTTAVVFRLLKGNSVGIPAPYVS